MARIDLLDHGYLELIEVWGSDERIIESARMSTNKGFQGWGRHCTACGILESGPLAACHGNTFHTWAAGDEKLLRYLYEHSHLTPFEMAGATFEVKAPIAVFREWQRHRAQGYNELSARYTTLPDEDYLPSITRLLHGADGQNKQAGAVSGAPALTKSAAEAWRDRLRYTYAAAEACYQAGLQLGVPKELARLPVTVGRYSRMRATANLRNWLGFCQLRSTTKNPHAQWEIRQYGDTTMKLLAEKFPRTLALFNEEK